MNGLSAKQPPSECLPEVGELVQVRSRKWLVEEVIRPEEASQSPVVRLACADDDAQGQSLEVFWDYELDRRILEEEGWRDLAARGFDPPGTSRRSSTPSGGTASRPPIRTSSRRRSALGSRSTPTRWSLCARRYGYRAPTFSSPTTRGLANYGIETKFTRAVRDLAGRFEHRLFLSATPHNGHSNSFSTLLELLDPYRDGSMVPRGNSP